MFWNAAWRGLGSLLAAGGGKEGVLEGRSSRAKSQRRNLVPRLKEQERTLGRLEAPGSGGLEGWTEGLSRGSRSPFAVIGRHWRCPRVRARRGLRLLAEVTGGACTVDHGGGRGASGLPGQEPTKAASHPETVERAEGVERGGGRGGSERGNLSEPDARLRRPPPPRASSAWRAGALSRAPTHGGSTWWEEHRGPGTGRCWEPMPPVTGRGVLVKALRTSGFFYM